MDEHALRLAFVGDVCLSFYRSAPLAISDFASWPAVKNEIGDHDFLLGNLECCLVDERCGEKVRKVGMAIPVEAAALLEALGFSDLCLANNHSLDCGAEAISVARERLASLGIRAYGAGPDLRGAEETIIAECKGRKIAFVGACDASEYYAAEARPGIAPLEKRRLGGRVRAAAERADLVVVTLHADLEFCDVPARWRQRLSRWLIDRGAHLVIQHHPHVLQGIETYRNGLIAYSLGNFIFKLHGNRYQERQAGVYDSVVLVVDAAFNDAKPKLEYRIVPLRIGTDHLPAPLTGPAHAEAIRRIQTLSALVADRKIHRRIWFQRCRAEAIQRTLGIYHAFGHRHFRRGVKALVRLLKCREDRRWIVGLLSLGYL